MYMTPTETVQIIQFLVEKLHDISGIDHDEILEDLKYNEVQEKTKKKKKKNKESK